MKSSVSSAMSALMVIVLLQGIALIGAGCAGATGGSSNPATTSVIPTPNSASKSSAKKSVNSSIQMTKALGILRGDSQSVPGVTASRAMERTLPSSRSAAYSYHDSETGCTVDYEFAFIWVTDDISNIDATYVYTGCTNPYKNGTMVLTGTKTNQPLSTSGLMPTTAYMDTTATFSQASSTLQITYPVTANYSYSTREFTPATTTITATFNGTDLNNYTYTNMTMTKTADGDSTISGTIKDSGNYAVTFSNSTVNSDGSANLNIATSDGVTGVIAIATDGSGSATFTSTSTGNTLLSMVWDTDGRATITYANGATDTTAIDVSG